MAARDGREKEKARRRTNARQNGEDRRAVSTCAKHATGRGHALPHGLASAPSRKEEVRQDALGGGGRRQGVEKKEEDKMTRQGKPTVSVPVRGVRRGRVLAVGQVSTHFSTIRRVRTCYTARRQKGIARPKRPAPSAQGRAARVAAVPIPTAKKGIAAVRREATRRQRELAVAAVQSQIGEGEHGTAKGQGRAAGRRRLATAVSPTGRRRGIADTARRLGRPVSTPASREGTQRRKGHKRRVGIASDEGRVPRLNALAGRLSGRREKDRSENLTPIEEAPVPCEVQEAIRRG